MSDLPLPFSGFDREGLYLAAVMMCAADNSDPASILKAVEAYAEATIVEFPATEPYPQSYLVQTQFDVVAVFAGTQTKIEWVYNVLGSPQGPNPGVPGQVDTWFYQAATVITGRMQADILAGAPGRKLTYIGHSLGGAIAQIMYQLLLTQITGVSQVYTFGCPRVGDPVFAAAFGINRLFRVENLNDPIPSLPPQLWAAVGSNYPIPGLPPVAVYTNGGLVQTLDYQGNLSAGQTPTATQAIVNSLLGTQPYVAHQSAEYVRRLGLQNFFGAGAGADFEVEAAAVQTIIVPEDRRLEPMAPTPTSFTAKVEVFYSFNGSGFSEVWYSAQTPDNLIAQAIPFYINARLNLATQSVRALYARVSLIGKPRQVSFWAPGFAWTGATPGQVAGNIKGGSISSIVPQPYVGTYNGFDVQVEQALLVRIRNTGNFWTRLFLHGFPAEVITGGFYTPTANFVLAFNSFINFLKGPTSNWLSVSTTPNAIGNRISIVSIAANPTRGATITYTIPNPAPGNFPPAVGNSVTIGGAGALEVGMNGRKVITSVLPNNPAGQGVFVVGGAAPIGAGPQAGSAYFYLNTLTGFPLQQAQVERLSSRDPGKVVFQYPGRRKNTIPLRR